MEIGVHKAIIFRELKRNTEKKGYRPQQSKTNHLLNCFFC